MKREGLTLTMIFLAESANYGEGVGNISTLKKMSSGNYQQFSYISRQAMRYNIIQQLKWDNTPVDGKSGVVQFDPGAYIDQYPEIDLFGYMKTVGKDDQSKGGAFTRSAVARLSLAKLITDGRIHPTRIEEIVEKMQREVDKTIKQAGDEACNETGIFNLNGELVKILGRLKYRASYGQNVLKHSIETSIIAGLLASEMGANVKIAKRGGLLHDIGKALDQELEGTHVQIGVELARKYGESEEVVHCIEAHHFNVEFKTIEAVIVQVADAISSSRPGARRDSFENYIKRLQQLEEIANSFKGVEKSFAVQAGREVRIIVKPEEISDSQAMFMAKEIATKIENEMQYPGHIKVNVIRESRFVETAK